MKALVIDSAASNMVIAAKNEDITATLSLDLGQKQSQKILPAIDYVLKQVELDSKELDYTALCSGPGTFTGLRLAYSALKAIELAHEIPIYGIPSLEVYAQPFFEFEQQIVSVIDAKKDQFFAAVYDGKKLISDAEDTTPQKVYELLDKKRKILVAGPDAEIFAGLLKEIDPSVDVKHTSAQPLATEALFALAETYIQQKKEPLADYDGPVYLRKSEAEIALQNKAN